MSMIITGMTDMPESCFREYPCPLSDGEYGECQYSSNITTTYDIEDGRPKNCPLKSIDGLIEFIKAHSYPIRYDKNSIEQGMTVTGIEQSIKEYCEVDT